MLPQADRHSLRVRNVGQANLRIGHSQGDANSTNEYLELNVGEEKYFRIHYLALEGFNETTAQVVYHSEWDDELWIRNPSAVQTGTVEIYEVY
jgi:hypothetical protein